MLESKKHPLGLELLANTLSKRELEAVLFFLDSPQKAHLNMLFESIFALLCSQTSP